MGENVQSHNAMQYENKIGEWWWRSDN